MASVYPDIANSPYQDFSSTAPTCNELKSKTVLMELIMPEKAGELDAICQDLDRMLVKKPSGRFLLEFDVETNENGRPAKYSKQQVYNILDQIVPYLEVLQAYFFWWVANETNLADNQSTVKTMHKRAFPSKKGTFGEQQSTHSSLK